MRAPRRDVSRRRAVTLLPALAGWVIGMLFAFHPMILSHFAAIQGDWADARLTNYILEHGYRWLMHAPGHERFWSPPVFFPAPNTAAYSDVLLGVAPFYWPWRALGIAADTSFQLWTLTIATANYLAALALFARGFRCRPLAAAAGAALFCFGSIRNAQLIHPQLEPQFYLAIAVLALVRLFESDVDPQQPEGARMRDDVWIGVLALACVGQLYTSYYNAWFLLRHRTRLTVVRARGSFAPTPRCAAARAPGYAVRSRGALRAHHLSARDALPAGVEAGRNALFPNRRAHAPAPAIVGVYGSR